MAGANITFNMEAVQSASARSTDSIPGSQVGDSTAIGTQFEAVQSAGILASGTPSAATSCQCEGSFLVPGGGPGVTTLSIGEEEGLGDYLSTPVVDGVEFLEPGIQDFASAGPAEITTLAIGEEGGGMASTSHAESLATQSYAPFEPSHEVVSQPQSVTSVVEYIDESYIGPVDVGFTDGIDYAGLRDGYGTMDPIYSPGDQRIADPVAMASIETMPVAAQQAPESIAILETTPLPMPTPADAIASADAAPYATPLPASPLPVPGPAISAPQTASSTPIPLEKPAVFSAAAPEAPASSSSGGAQAGSYEYGDVFLTPRAKPTLFATQGGSQGHTEIVPANISDAVPSGSEGYVPVGDYDSYAATQGADAANPAAASMPEEAQTPVDSTGDGANAPELSDDDYRITTLALGEEEAGGG